jgi:hypothetical protein
VHSTYAVIENCVHDYFNLVVVFLTDWDSALWPSCAQYHVYTVRSQTTKIYLSCQLIHYTCYTSVYQLIFTSYWSPFTRIYLQLNLLAKPRKDTGETLTKSNQLFLHSLIPYRFYCTDCQQHSAAISLWNPCWPNQSGNIWRSTHIPLLWAICIINDNISPNIRLNVWHEIVITVFGIIEVAIQVKCIVSILNHSQCAIIFRLVDG